MLVQAVQHNPTAFAELYRRYLTPVYRYQMARVSNAHDAQDLTAQTFLATQESLTHYRHQNKFAAWLMSIARRKVAAHFRRKRPTLPLEMAEHIAHSTASAEEMLDRQLLESMQFLTAQTARTGKMPIPQKLFRDSLIWTAQ
ncbi:MAG: hypothetical protein HC879_16370 [Leptolyngbyaceae cyanobacterium SL_5_9]|nr:hypothetical protein [Leptolyngbyaceae cyanobacterium SL_5_9]